MSTILSGLTIVVLIGMSTPASAQFVKGNEAISAETAGSKRAETAPLPATGTARILSPCKADAHCHAGPWLMVETKNGLVECTEVYARPGTCRPSTYGTKKISRLWVVKSKGTWLQCQYPDLASKCVPVFARPPANLPYPALQ